MNIPRKLITNCSELVTCRQNSDDPITGADLSRVEVIQRGALVISGETIEWVGQESQLETVYYKIKFDEIVDAGGGVVTPGLVDPHTHPVFAATRENEFYMRNTGRSYMEIAAEGGGIRNSVRKLRETDAEDLFVGGLSYLDQMLRSGTTTIEAKSGYGLSTEAEIKSLEVIKRLNDEHPIDLVPTFLGAHEFPDEYRDNRNEYIKLLINEMIPTVAEKHLAEFCDIFTEAGVYDIEQSRQVMTTAKDYGFGLKFHADELQSVGGAELAAELGAISADHLVHISERGIEMMAQKGVTAILLPCTTFFLGHREYAPARRMIERGVPVALATDFNPGSSFTTSLPVTMTIAAIYLKMSPEEILNAVTYNAAYGIGREKQIGSLQESKLADFVIWNVKNYRQIPYHFGQNLIDRVYKRGRKVV